MRRSLFFLSFILIVGFSFGQSAKHPIQKQKTQKKPSRAIKPKHTLTVVGKTRPTDLRSRDTKSSIKFNGQWRGYFDGNGNIGSFSSDNTEYVLELDIEGSHIRGNSYSYFQNRRYYVICSLSGTYDPAERSVTVTETARIKGLTPPDWTDCLQRHILKYKKENGVENLVGKWEMAHGQTGNCGYGTTVLTRKTLKNSIASYKGPQNINSPFSAPNPHDLAGNVKQKPKAPNLIDKNTSKEKTQLNTQPVEPAITQSKEPEVKKETSDIVEQKSTEKSTEEKKLDKRTNNILKTIEIENEKFVVTLYDNGEIDGDSVSLFYNGKLLISHQMLSDKPMTLTLSASTGKEVNELTMYAENLGTIPPNTALMIVMDGDTRYEVRITSDLQRSGTIRFVHKSRPKK
jgi:hypothetical protein